MILGFFLRNYKIYKNYYFIPFSDNTPDKLSVLIGDNGVGKSSIMESLNSYFNDFEWVVSKGGKRDEAVICPLFLLNADDFDADEEKYLKCINDFFMNVEVSDDPNYKKAIERFFPYRDKIKDKVTEGQYLFIYSKTLSNTDKLFMTFNDRLERKLEQEVDQYDRKKLMALCSKVVSLYSYTYIPVETSLSEFLRLEEKEFQDLMDHDLKEKIRKILDVEKLIPAEGRGQNKTIIRTINDHLKEMLVDLEKDIKSISPKYSFQHEQRARVNITANHLIDDIIKAFCSKRTFKLGSTPVKNLSAGERKKALIDIAYAFLGKDSKKDKQIILAVDEPEASLHISKCFNQFKKLYGISMSLNHQVLIGTHWYGSLPILDEGSVIHLEKVDADSKEEKVFVRSFSSKNYFEKRDKSVADVHMKGFFDLVSSIISSIRQDSNNWLIVEGSSDKNYLSKTLGDVCQIIPVRGEAAVKIVYEYLRPPLSHEDHFDDDSGKIFCLIDSDENEGKKIVVDDGIERLSIRRIQNKNEHVTLESLNSTGHDYEVTDIEECLISELWIKVVKECATAKNDELTLSILEMFDVEDKPHSRIRGDDGILNYQGGSLPLKDAKAIIIKFIQANKSDLSNRYAKEINDDTPILPWQEEIRDFFAKEE